MLIKLLFMTVIIALIIKTYRFYIKKLDILHIKTINSVLILLDF